MVTKLVKYTHQLAHFVNAVHAGDPADVVSRLPLRCGWLLKPRQEQVIEDLAITPFADFTLNHPCNLAFRRFESCPVQPSLKLEQSNLTTDHDSDKVVKNGGRIVQLVHHSQSISWTTPPSPPPARRQQHGNGMPVPQRSASHHRHCKVRGTSL